MNKQIIEEMAQCKNFNGYTCKSCGVKNACDRYILAEELYNAGYRKITDGVVVLTREEYDELQKGIKTYNYTAMFEAQNAYRWEQGYFIGCKETAEKFAEKVSQAIVDNTYPYFDKDGKPVNIWNAVLGFDKIDEICKEITDNE